MAAAAAAADAENDIKLPTMDPSMPPWMRRAVGVVFMLGIGAVIAEMVVMPERARAG